MTKLLAKTVEKKLLAKYS